MSEGRLELELAAHLIVDMIGEDTDPASVHPPIPEGLQELIRLTQELRKAHAAVLEAEAEVERWS